MQVYLILALLMALLVTVFAVQNNAVIAVTLFAWRIEGSLAIILMGTLFLGILVGVFLITPTAIRGRLIASDLRKKLQKSEQDLEEARKIQLFPSTSSTAEPEGKADFVEGEGESDFPPTS
jgi:putative membrane protein